MIYAVEKSEPAVAAVKPANQAASAAAERVEPSAGTEVTAAHEHPPWTQRRSRLSQWLDRVRQVARLRKKEKFTALMHRADAPR